MKPLQTEKARVVVDKRTGEKPVPDNLEDHLSHMQIKELRLLEGSGYKIKFIRRSLFQDVVVVVVADPQEKEIGVLREDGSLDFNPDLQYRL